MKILLFLFIVFYFIACGQENKETIKSSKDIYSLNKDIKKIPEEPIYKIIPTPLNVLSIYS